METHCSSLQKDDGTVISKLVHSCGRDSVVPTVFAVSGATQLLLAGALWWLLAAHRDLVANAFAADEEPAAP